MPFSEPGRGGDATGFASRAVELVDWNGDHKLDLLALGEGPRQQRTDDGKTEGLPVSTTYGLVVFLNAGEKGWVPLSHGQTGGTFGDSLAVGNWNADQHPDVVTASYTLGNRDLLQVNSGKADTPTVVSAIPSLRANAWVFGVVAGDFDGDRRDDVVTSFATYEVDVARRGLELSRVNAEGVWRTELIAAYEGKDNLWSLARGDLDGDGHLDLVATTERGNVKVYLGDGSGGFALEESPELDPPGLVPGIRPRAGGHRRGWPIRDRGGVRRGDRSHARVPGPDQMREHGSAAGLAGQSALDVVTGWSDRRPWPGGYRLTAPCA